MANVKTDVSSSESDDGLFNQQVEMEQNNYVTQGEMIQPATPNNNIISNPQQLHIPMQTNTIPIIGDPRFNTNSHQPASPSSSQAVLIKDIAGNEVNQPTNTADITTKTYCIVGWRILVHLLILYAVALSTYLLITRHDNNCDCNGIISDQFNAGDLTTEPPTQSPPILESTTSTTTTTTTTIQPSKSPTLFPSPSPSLSPTDNPTFSPTQYYEKFDHFIGDYKISAQASSHGDWILCDGSFLDSDTYPILFNVLGYSFGSFTGDTTIFGLPDSTDQIPGISGSSHNMGDTIGSETIALSESNVPSHWHYIARRGDCQADPSTSYPYLADDCYSGSNLLNNAEDKYELKAHASVPNTHRTNTGSGSGSSFSIMQPTLFVGNLFIYADPQS